MAIKWVELSKTMSYSLRHAPDKFGLHLDDEGWTSIADLLQAMRRHRHDWQAVNEADIDTVLLKSTKQRFEICAGRIRALYGHSAPLSVAKLPAEPPTHLYHGTKPAAADAILREGLRPMTRQYVHLSIDEQTADIVGRRKAKKPTILLVLAGHAYDQGVAFYRGNDDIWLADHVPASFIERLATA